MNTNYNEPSAPQRTTAEPSILYTFDDTGNAKRLVNCCGQRLRYSYTEKSWIYWDKIRWKYDDSGEIYRAIDEMIDRMNVELDYYMNYFAKETVNAFVKHMGYSRSHKAKAACEHECRSRLPVAPDELDRHKMLFNTQSAVFSLEDGGVLRHSTDMMITKLSPIDIREKADCPRWKRFLSEIFRGDEELIRYIQKAVGYSLTGRTDEQCAFFLLGSGNNGKSVFLNVLRDICGDYAVNIQAESLMIKLGTSGASSDIARLRGARLVTSAETNEGVRLNESLLKQLTGGDVVTARKLYANEFEFIPEFKLWMATNHKPIIRGTDKGIWRRIHLIPFTVDIPEERVDKQLGEKLREEYPAILYWALEGCMLWQKEGLGMPAAVQSAVNEYRREMDVISAFLDDCCAEREGVTVKSSVLYAAYAQWSEANNEYKMSNTRFGIEVSKRFEKISRPDGKHYVGIGLHF